ncbi:hypothetical protein EGW08_014039 [Elysia chlorotica]|uniref:DIX domain-containing protein n=1 Tax=Elysia chlorotica TaxID=188477 RepID=A0A433T9H4_ELYCH|nr:hypothetical protein EGW08_014039 [Elysia chlorotica]
MLDVKTNSTQLRQESWYPRPVSCVAAHKIVRPASRARGRQSPTAPGPRPADLSRGRPGRGDARLLSVGRAGGQHCTAPAQDERSQQQQRRREPRLQGGATHGISPLDGLEDSIVQLLRKMSVHNSNSGDASPGSQHRVVSAMTYRDKQRVFGSSTPSRQGNNVSQNHRHTGVAGVGAPGNNTTRVTSVRGQGFNNSPSRNSPGRPQKAPTAGVAKPGPQVSPRPSTAAHTLNRARPLNSQVPRPKSYVMGTVTEGQTTVLYHTPQVEKPSTCLIHKKLGEIRLRDFKSAVGESNLYHYYFKAYDPEYGQVKEEVFQDDDILPGYEGKIVAWLEEEGGTTV